MKDEQQQLVQWVENVSQYPLGKFLCFCGNVPEESQCTHCEKYEKALVRANCASERLIVAWTIDQVIAHTLNPLLPLVILPQVYPVVKAFRAQARKPSPAGLVKDDFLLWQQAQTFCKKFNTTHALA